PAAAVSAAAQHFLEDLQWQHPDAMDHLLAADFPRQNFASSLLGHLAEQLTAAPQASLREELARRRVEVLLPAGTPPASITALLGKLKEASPAYYQRLLGGRIEDDDLIPLLKDAQLSSSAPAKPAAAKPTVLTAADILSAFSTHNQTGLALSHLRAYTVEGTLKLPNGEEQRLLLFKLRPDRFRLHVMAGEVTQYILAYNGTSFWQQAPGTKPQIVSRAELGSRAYLAEFVNPLFGDLENYNFTRLDDGTIDGKKVYRLAVHRPDGSQYVACIDPDSFREIGGEYDNGVSVRYSDFRAAAGGLTMAFREETTDRAGHTDIFLLQRISANPGLVQEFFQPRQGVELSYFAFEQISAPGQPPALLRKN